MGHGTYGLILGAQGVNGVYPLSRRNRVPVVWGLLAMGYKGYRRSHGTPLSGSHMGKNGIPGGMGLVIWLPEAHWGVWVQPRMGLHRENFGGMGYKGYGPMWANGAHGVAKICSQNIKRCQVTCHKRCLKLS